MADKKATRQGYGAGLAELAADVRDARVKFSLIVSHGDSPYSPGQRGSL